MKNEIISGLIRAFVLSVFLSPSFYVENGSIMVLPSAVVFQINGSRLGALVSVIIATAILYFFLKWKQNPKA